ncbi:ABC transporter ATP-binding protein [Aureimonas endophytica]|uniref:ABC transporter ATP-binding protein n=1 Tax=Aureimonas endophytica TaxID=2027858 RepID=A0A917EDN8_9HYPH|nr:oligopeptide/dipeptide ABC transporter ATP-binding protein [Aureimonas endophytica]GGE23148.1 ABC transporter ATP-binding protein [Aureimonas endophytica]
MTAAVPNRPLLRASGIVKRYDAVRSLVKARRRVLTAVDNVSFDVMPGETLGLVGESGCGKSTLGRCLTRLTELSDGRLEFDGAEIGELSNAALRPFRARLQMVFQDPYASLNPRRRVGDLLAEPLRVHRLCSEKEIPDRVAELLASVELPAEHASRFPHEFSGGQRQRIGIARAIALKPKLIVADEPVSALDVSVQAQIVNLFCDLRERFGLTYVFIAHDLAVVRQISTRVAVMYLGSVVEIGAADEIFEAPRHPYTAALLEAIPEPHAGRRTASGESARRVAREVPSPLAPPPGCRFEPRCPRAQDRCRAERPMLSAAPGGAGTLAACHFPLS